MQGESFSPGPTCLGFGTEGMFPLLGREIGRQLMCTPSSASSAAPGLCTALALRGFGGSGKGQL